jgi:hypothetical protein
VGIGDRKLGRHVRHNVSVVNHPVSFGNALSHKVGEIFIAHSWLSKGIEGIAVAKDVVDVEASEGGESRSQAIAGGVDLCVSVEGKQFLNFCSDVPLNSREGSVEALVNVASRAAWVRNLGKEGSTCEASRSTIQF